MSYNRRKVNSHGSALDDASELLFIVESEWPKLSQKNFNPLDTVLPLLDNTSVGLAHKQSKFDQLNTQISQVLNSCISGNKQQFIDHLNYYSDVSRSFNESFELVEQISKDLSMTNESIVSDNKTYLKDLNQSSMVYGRLLDTIELVEFVKSATEDLNKFIGDKDFVQCEELVNKCFKLAKEYELWKLPLLQSIRNQLNDQLNNLFEMVVEELHGIIYLKLNLNKNLIKFNNNNKLIDISSKCLLINKSLTHFISKLHDGNHEDEDHVLMLQNLILEDDENFNKLRNLLIVLHKLGKFDKLLDILVARESTELNQLFNQTVEDIKRRIPSSMTSSNFWQDNNDLLLLEFGPSSQESIKLRELFQNIFNNSLVVLQYHRIVYEIGSKFGHDYAIEKIFDIMESSIRNVITQYIHDDNITDPTRNTKMNKMNNSKRLKLFEFIIKENDEMKSLSSQLQEFFPSFAVDEKIYIDSNEQTATLDTIVEPGIFNMRVILEPFLVFVEGSKMIMPMSKKLIKGSDSFFIEYMRNDFLKNFNYTLQFYYDSICNSNDSFDILINNNGIFKSCEVFKKYLYSVLEMLNTSLIFKEEYVNSVFILFNAFSNRFQLYFQEISDEADIPWLEDTKLTQVSLELIHTEDESILSQEIELIFQNLNIGNEIAKIDILFEKSSQLLHSVTWLLEWLKPLIRIENANPVNNLTKIETYKKDWELIDINYNHSHEKQIYLTLDSRNHERFNKFIGNFESLADNIQLILRYNLIYQSSFLVSRFFNTNDFFLLNEIGEPDSHILKLITVFLNANKIFNRNLPNHSQIVIGLSNLLDLLFIKGSFKIKRLNENGLKKIFLNILILQQLLRNLFHMEIKFTNSVKYFENFRINDKGILDQISKKRNKFSIEENSNMIRLIYSEDPTRNMKRYNDSLAKLQQLYK